jgi:transposase
MSNVSKRVFMHKYRAEAVKWVINEGMILAYAARKLGLSVKTYSKWVCDPRAGSLAQLDSYRAQPVCDLQAEVSRLKRELALACEERDILKKATAYYAKVGK